MDSLTTMIIVGRGRMGSCVRRLVEEAPDMHFVASYDENDAFKLDTAAPAVKLVIDFSAAPALPHIEAYVRRTHAAVVSGTTGLSDEELARLSALGAVAPVVHAANYSLGVAVLRRLTQESASALPGFDVEIVETHHNKKVDAPSGTAKLLVRAVDPNGQDEVVYGREGLVGARPARQIGMHSLRGGTVAGTHEVHFFGTDEELVLTHRASSRTIFASGALMAARALLKKPAGFYSFEQLVFKDEEN